MNGLVFEVWDQPVGLRWTVVWNDYELLYAVSQGWWSLRKWGKPSAIYWGWRSPRLRWATLPIPILSRMMPPRQLKSWKRYGVSRFIRRCSGRDLPKNREQDRTQLYARTSLSLLWRQRSREHGFVRDGFLLFPSKCKSGDYHDDMNWKKYEKCAKNQLKPNLQPHSVLVVDNTITKEP
jgi:hypothetical protein